MKAFLSNPLAMVGCSFFLSCAALAPVTSAKSMAMISSLLKMSYYRANSLKITHKE
ncbi:hypothetical protein KVC41_04370 [Helicobacter pylori]|nr:hypothetical protein KVC41_04370 [Helicobacter pylori]